MNKKACSWEVEKEAVEMETLWYHVSNDTLQVDWFLKVPAT